MGLRTKFLKHILPPSIIGILINVGVVITFLLTFYLNLITDTKENIVNQEYTSIKSISDSLALSLQEFFLLKLSYLEEAVNYSETLLTNPNNSDNMLFNITSLNAYDLYSGKINISALPEYNFNYDLTTAYCMWFLDQNSTEISELSTETLNHLLIANSLELEFKAIFSSVPNLTSIFMVFMDDGLQYVYPATRRLRYGDQFTSDTECPFYPEGKVTHYDLRCTPQIQFGINSVLKSAPTNTTLFVSKPFVLMEFQQVGVTLCASHYKNSTASNFSNIPQSERQLDYLICAEFIFQDMNELMEQATGVHKGIYYVLDRFGNMVYHPGFKSKYYSAFDVIGSITEYEFGEKDSLNNSLAVEYNKTILPSILSTFNQISDINDFQNQIIKLQYKRNDGEYIGTLSPIFFPITGKATQYHGANLIFIEPSDLVMQPFENIKVSIYRMIMVQSIGVCVVVIFVSWVAFRMINYIVNSIITPLTDLSEVVMKMLNDDLDTDVTRNYTPNSEEITQLYQSFSKLKFLMKYANAEFFSGNDAQALINYSNALKLYEEINNTEGIGMTYNNIGNIHLKNKRYEEAINYYRKAVELIENDLNAYYKDNSFFRNSTKENKNKKVTSKALYTRSRRNYKSHKKAENQQQIIDDNTLKKMNELYSNRLFQLGLTLYHQVFTNNREGDLQEIIDIFEKVIQIDSYLQINPARTIQSLIFISNCFLELGNHLASLKYLNEAESSVFLYETAQNMLEFEPQMIKSLKEYNDREVNGELEYLITNSTQFTIKPDILKQLWMYHSALFCKKMGKFKQACIMYTKTLETGKIYDPLIRKKCLEDMSFILASQGLLSKAPNITTILNRLDCFKGKEIVFLLDVSESMGEGARLKYAIRNFLKIFDKYLRPDDKVCFIRFNYICEVVFNLTPKKNNTIQLRRQIESTCKTQGGTAFYDAIDAGISEFDNVTKDSQEDGSNANSYWIVALTDGEDNCSKLSADFIKKQLKYKGINLIIVGLGLGNESIPILSELCKATNDGVFIETPNNDDLDIAFEAISDIIYGPNFIVETFSFS